MGDLRDVLPAPEDKSQRTETCYAADKIESHTPFHPTQGEALQKRQITQHLDTAGVTAQVQLGKLLHLSKWAQVQCGSAALCKNELLQAGESWTIKKIGG